MLESFLLESVGAVFASVFAAAVADGVEVGEEEEDEEKNKIMKTMEWKTVEVNLEGILPILSFLVGFFQKCRPKKIGVARLIACLVFLDCLHCFACLVLLDYFNLCLHSFVGEFTHNCYPNASVASDGKWTNFFYKVPCPQRVDHIFQVESLESRIWIKKFRLRYSFQSRAVLET